MFHVICAVLGTMLLAARVCILGALGIGAVLCAGYFLYWYLRYGGAPDMSIAGLYPVAYEYLLPPRYIVCNTILIFCLRLPLVISLGALFLLAVLLDALGSALARWVEAALRADKTG